VTSSSTYTISGGNVKSHRSKATAIVTTFGAGLACAGLAPSAEAAIVNLTPSPQTVAYLGGCIPIDLGPAAFIQCNDVQGKTMYAAASLGIVGLRTAPASSAITVGQAFVGAIFRGVGGTGTSTFAFLTTANQVGWFRVNFGAPFGPLTYLGGAFNDTPGGSIHSGTSAVPEPATLALLGLAGLAAGARGITRRRETKSLETT
jgi:hypothetical protein